MEKILGGIALFFFIVLCLNLLRISIYNKFFAKKDAVEYFYRKEDGSVGRMSTKEIAEEMKRPLTQEEMDGFPIEFAKKVAAICGKK